MYEINNNMERLAAEAHGLYLRLRDRAIHSGHDAVVKRAYHRYERRILRRPRAGSYQR